MSEMKQRWDDGVELAYILNDVMDMNKLWQILTKNDVSGMSDELVNRMEETRMSKRTDMRRKPSASRHKGVPHMVTPEPYKSLANSVGDFVFAITQNRWVEDEKYPRKLVSKKGAEAQKQLGEAVNALIGREVEIENINPYKFEQSA